MLDIATKNYKEILDFIDNQILLDTTKDLIKEWLKYKTKGSYTVGQVRNNLTEVYKEVNGDVNLFNQALKQAINRGWQSVYAPKNQNNSFIKELEKEEEPVKTVETEETNDYWTDKFTDICV